MPTWNELIDKFDDPAYKKDPQRAVNYLTQLQHEELKRISKLRGGRNVLFYSSAFLQKPRIDPLLTSITSEDINGFMSCMNGMDWGSGLTMLLHTPGGETNATETIVDYLLSKFDKFEVVVPTYAMSAGTMISLASDEIVMGRQSQLGPIDPQLPTAGGMASAQAIVAQFTVAQDEILLNADKARIWAPILSSLGPSLLTEANQSLAYSETLVKSWLEARMFKNSTNPGDDAARVASYFNRGNPDTPKDHGRRINRAEAKAVGVNVTDLEDDQTLQEAVLTAYHCQTILFEKSLAAKNIFTNHNRRWVKNSGAGP